MQKIKNFEDFKNAHHIYPPVCSHPEKFWAAVPKNSIDPQVDMITARDRETIEWLLEVNYQTWIKKTSGMEKSKRIGI